jgi:putative DNA primase/helicase
MSEEPQFHYIPLHGFTSPGVCACGRCAPTSNSRGKHPRLSDWQSKTTTDLALVESWRAEGHNVGIATGEVSDLFVLDTDLPKKPGEADGRDTIFDLEKKLGSLPETLTVATGSGGIQFYFRYPKTELRNAVKFAPGLDIRTTGGLVVAAGSTHHSGRNYEVSINKPLAELPEEWVTFIAEHQLSSTKKSHTTTTGSFAEGSRNASLTSVAGLFRRFGLKGEELYSVLAAQNVARCHPPLPESEVRTIANSVSNYADHPAPDFRATETWAAEQFAEQHKNVARFVTDLKQWFVWDGTRWSPDRLDRIVEFVKLYVRSLSFLASSIPEDGMRNTVAKFALSCESANKRHSIESLIRGESTLKITSNYYNTNPWLFNIQNGTIEIDPESKTWKFREHRREDFLSQIADVNYDPEAKCPRWDRFLTEVFPGQPEVVRFLQKSIGYSLTGSIREAIMWLLRGAGRNGKGTIIKTIGKMFGDYAIGVKIEFFLMRKNEDGGPRDGRYQLIGKRFVSASEPADGRRLNTANLKELIDPDGKLSAGKLYSTEDIPFDATQHYWLSSNDDLVIRGDDQAMWDRLRRIEFTERFADSGDITLKDDLWKEKDGIFNWVLEGLGLYLQEGIKDLPKEVKNATTKYQAEQDQVGRFIAEAKHPDTADTDLISAHTLYVAYKEWAMQSLEAYDSETAFGLKLSKKFPIKGRDWKKTRSVKVYLGFKLRPEFEPRNTGVPIY